MEQYRESISQIGVLLALFVAMGTVAQEKDKGTAARQESIYPPLDPGDDGDAAGFTARAGRAVDGTSAVGGTGGGGDVCVDRILRQAQDARR